MMAAGKMRIISAMTAFSIWSAIRNAQTAVYGDLYKWGIIDPAKVVRTAIEDAASVRQPKNSS